MTVVLKDTYKVISHKGISVRLWEGNDENGNKVVLYVSKVVTQGQADFNGFIGEIVELSNMKKEFPAEQFRIF